MHDPNRGPFLANGPGSGLAPPGGPEEGQAMTILAPVTRSGTSTDPRDPLARLENLFDTGTTVPLVGMQGLGTPAGHRPFDFRALHRIGDS